MGGNSGTIRDSYASGTVTGPNGQAGGVVGLNTGTTSNNFYNQDANNGLTANASNEDEYGYTGDENGGGGLTADQMNDVDYYIDGTIEEVLAQRELARQEQIRRDNLRTQTAKISGTLSPTTAVFNASTSEDEIAAGAVNESESLDEYLPSAEESKTAVGVASAGVSRSTLGYTQPSATASSPRRPAAARQPRPRSFSADVKTITSDEGTSYDLQNDKN